VGARNPLVGRLEIDQEPSLLGEVQRVPKANGGVTGKGRRGLLQRPFAAIVGERGQGLLNSGGGPSRRHLDRDRRDAQAARTELFVLQPEVGEV
jgi:hypothetical protein